MAFIVLDYMFTKSVQSELCFTLQNPAHATYSDFFTAVKMTIFSRNLIFHIFAQNIDCGYTTEAVLTSTHNLCFCDELIQTSTHNLGFRAKI